jgi:hypothetical protein
MKAVGVWPWSAIESSGAVFAMQMGQEGMVEYAAAYFKKICGQFSQIAIARTRSIPIQICNLDVNRILRGSRLRIKPYPIVRRIFYDICKPRPKAPIHPRP